MAFASKIPVLLKLPGKYNCSLPLLCLETTSHRLSVAKTRERGADEALVDLRGVDFRILPFCLMNELLLATKQGPTRLGFAVLTALLAA
jgi:hypothetical protein